MIFIVLIFISCAIFKKKLMFIHIVLQVYEICMKQFFAFLLLFAFPSWTFAAPYFSSLLPNPLGDDTLGEYIEIRNTGCSMIDIAWYDLRDLQKWYIFPSSTHIESKTNFKLEYAVSKISLNNSGIETLMLKDASGVLIDSYSYSGTQKDNVVLTIWVTDDICEVLSPLIEGTWSENISTWTILIWTIIPDDDIDSTVSQTGSIVVSGEMISSTWFILDSTGVIQWSGSITESWTSIENSGGTLPSEITDGTWIIIDTGSTQSSPEIITLVPIEMWYSDTDSNNRIDTLEICYPYILSWTVNTGAILLSSRSWGLSQNKIDTQTGYILSGSLSGSTLILSLLEWDLFKTDLHITNSTTSDLRLKSTTSLWFESVEGYIPENFFLTSSFDDYKKVFKKIPTIQDEVTATGVFDSSWWVIQSWMISSWSSIDFPEIFPYLQSPTNALFASWAFECMESSCRINITLDPLFSSGYSMKDYFCYFWTGEVLLLDTDCNPTTYYFTSSGSIDIELVARNDTNQKISKSFPVHPYKESVSTLGIWMEEDTNPPVIILEFDGKWHDYYKRIWEYEYECYTFTCAINLTAERSYDREWWEVRYMWMYDMMNLTEKKDPWERKFTLWDHTIWLRVIDIHGNMSEVFFRISVLGKKLTEEKDTIKTIKSPKKKTEKVSSSKEKKKKKKVRIQKFSFFDPPEILIQNKDSKTKKYIGFDCTSTTKTCSFNFTLSWTTKNIVYTWVFDDGTVIESQNPRSKVFSKWVHTVMVSARYSGTDVPLWSESINLKVVQIKKPKNPKKPKKISTKKKVTKSPKVKKRATEVTMSPFVAPNENQSLPYELIYLLSWASSIYLFRRRLFPKLSTFREQDKDTEKKSH